MYRLKRIEIVFFNTSGARQTTSQYIVKKAPYPEISSDEKTFRRNLKKYLNHWNRSYANEIFSTSKKTRMVKVVTNKTVFYL